MENSKKCKHCCSEIPIQAKKCPKCQGVQSQFGNMVSIVAMLLLLSAFLVFTRFIDSDQETESTDLISNIEITESNLIKNDDRLFIFGMISNRGTIDLQQPSVRINFYDSASRLIDSQTNCMCIMKLKKGETIPFKIRIHPLRKLDAYDRFDIKIIDLELCS